MSGPKISVYSLTGRARTIVVGQMRCEQQSLACAAQAQEMLRSLQSFSGSFEQQMSNIRLLMKRTSDGAGQIEKLLALQSRLQKETSELQRELRSHMPHVSAKYRITEEAYAEKQAELKFLQSLKSRIEKLKRALDEAFTQDQRNTSSIQASILRDLEDPSAGQPEMPDLSFLKRDNAQNVKKIQASIVDDLSGVTSFDFDVPDDAPDTSFEDKKSALRKELSELLKDESLSKEILLEVRQALSSLQKISDIEYLKTFDSVTVMGLFKKIDSFKHEQEQKVEAFGELLARYQALCSMAGEEPKSYSYSEESVSELATEIEHLELTLVKQQEQAYIAESVDEVMAGMGYDLIGSREVRKRSGKRFRNELFSFNEGTAVNVTFSPDGQISMELGGLAREDRIPSSEETEVLTRDMETFCGEFAEFERRLRAKGIIVGDRVALSPPTAEYAAIINVNDYDIAESTQISVMNAREKRRRAAEKKVLRRDE
jgi:RNase H-fold protein (predicted Holliday junction resolvase)